MPPKKVTKVTSASKKAAPAPHTSYRDMIKDAIISLKERNGSRYVLWCFLHRRCLWDHRQAIKKYVQSNNKINVTSQSVFDSQFNKAIKAGVEKNEFTQPKGPSGPLKLAKKEAPGKVTSKPAAKPATKAPAKPAVKKAATGPKKPASVKAPASKKTAAKKTATKPKANTGKARKTPVTAPAVVEQPKILGKTKSGRVTKTTAPQPTSTRAAPKKRTTKK
ncbi:Pc20g07890 [Penicillium rubens Wisconsin 54-1255]|uniref:Histone H1 n=1 Tax=Penicillium rubens (strain ATCC 28089 / DSM 1075 / NRRL 1951 / Wisconsin 54-1255) TaxID=500485 RepID=B6HEM1_PENRW|nr:Pc20g07890 [Penicillium rubens Wisconsin 54-1255]